MTYLCAVEAMNLDNLFGDCEDLSTTRGGGLMVLNIGADVAEGLEIPEENLFSSSASQGLMLIDAEDRERVEARVRAELAKDPILQHATIFTSAVPYDPDRFIELRHQLIADLRCQQMQASSVVYPVLIGRDVCDIDKVRPGKVRPDLPEKATQSDFTHERRKLGKEKKLQLFRDIFDELPKGLQIVDHLEDLASGGARYGNLQDKIALLRFDGNKFGNKSMSFKAGAELRDFSTAVRDQQAGYFRRLLSSGTEQQIAPHWWPYGKLQLEIIVYGGDEVSFIVPAWLGWHALVEFYRHTQNSIYNLTYAGAVVFCHYHTPIHSVKRLAKELADEAKSYGDRSACAMYQVLESFDAVGRDLGEYLKNRWAFASANEKGVCIDLQSAELLEEHMPDLRQSVSRRKLHEIAHALIKGPSSPDGHLIDSLLASKDVSVKHARSTLQQLHAHCGNAAFVHLLELWDYAGVRITEGARA